MDRQDLPLDSQHHANRIKDFVDDEKSLGRATKSEIAAAIGIQPSHFSNLLNGRNEWKLSHLQKLAEFLGVPLARLFEERGRKAETTPSGGGTLDSLEENIVRALQAETRTLRSGLREDLAALLRRHITDRQGLTPREFADDDTAAPYTDTPADHSAARPVEIHDLGAEYDKPPRRLLDRPGILLVRTRLAPPQRDRFHPMPVGQGPGRIHAARSAGRVLDTGEPGAAPTAGRPHLRVAHSAWSDSRARGQGQGPQVAAGKRQSRVGTGAVAR